jgi:tetratricopeptide (TPR) repeat protein
LRAALGGDAVSRSPSHHWKVAVLFARLRNFSEAIEALEYGDRIASANDPERPLYAGFVYLRSGRYIEGETLLRQYLQESNPSKKNAAIAYDLLGSELRRKLAIYEAESRFKSALKLKEKIGDFVGQGITLGNLGRIYLYTMRPVDAVSYFQRNLALADQHCPESEGIARNNLAEAQVVLGQYGRARDVLAPILHNDSRFTERDRGFAQVVLAEAALAEADMQTAKIALRDATNQFESCSEENGLFMVVELKGIVALSNGWMITANRLFRDFDAKLAIMADHLFSIYRWRRRALLASQFGDENVTMSALDQAKKNAIRNGLPSDDIDDEMIELRKLAQGLEPPFGTVAWFSYWQSRLPCPVANGLRRVHQHPLGWFRWAEETCEFLEALLLVALDEKAHDVDRLSFGQKVQGFRTMVREWTGKYTRSRSSWNSVVRSFEELVAMRNRTVHPTDSTVAPTDEEIIGVSRSILHFVARHISIHVSNDVIDIGEDTANSHPDQVERRGIVLDGQKVSVPVNLLRVQEPVSETDMAEDLTEPN